MQNLQYIILYILHLSILCYIHVYAVSVKCIVIMWTPEYDICYISYMFYVYVHTHAYMFFHVQRVNC